MDRQRTLLQMAQKMSAAMASEDWKMLAAINTLMVSTLPQMAAQGPWSAPERAALAALRQLHEHAVRQCDQAVVTYVPDSPPALTRLAAQRAWSSNDYRASHGKPAMLYVSRHVPVRRLIEGGLVRETTGLALAPAARLIGSPSGDVWAMIGDRTLLRFSAEGGVESGWDETIAPVFQRACSACHLPGGSSGLDLSTREAWASNRAPIRERVIVDRSMPPAGHALADPDREAIGRWLEPAR